MILLPSKRVALRRASPCGTVGRLSRGLARPQLQRAGDTSDPGAGRPNLVRVGLSRAGSVATCGTPIPPLVTATGLTFEFLTKVTPATPIGTPGVYTLAACEQIVGSSVAPVWLFDHDAGSHFQGQFGLGYAQFGYGYQVGDSNYGASINPTPPGLSDDAGTYHYWAYRLTRTSSGSPKHMQLDVFRDGVFYYTSPYVYDTHACNNPTLRLGGNFDHPSLVGTMACVRLNNFPVADADLLANALAVLAGGVPSIIPTHTVGLWLLQSDLLNTSGQANLDMTMQQAVAPVFVATGLGQSAIQFAGNVNTVTPSNVLLKCGQNG